MQIAIVDDRAEDREELSVCLFFTFLFREYGTAAARTRKGRSGSYGNATAPCGCLGRRMAAMQYAYNGLDIVQIRRWTEEIRETTAEDQKEAARIIRRLLEEAWIVTTGNQTAIEMDRDCFDRIRDFRSKMAE